MNYVRPLSDFAVLLSMFRLTAILPSDDPAIFKGSPIALQLVGRTLEDEAIIGMAEIVDAAIIQKLRAPEETQSSYNIC